MKVRHRDESSKKRSLIYTKKDCFVSCLDNSRELSGIPRYDVNLCLILTQLKQDYKDERIPNRLTCAHRVITVW
jgi:hypothetical protein